MEDLAEVEPAVQDAKLGKKCSVDASPMRFL